jgi:hypothetical protein
MVTAPTNKIAARKALPNKLLLIISLSLSRPQRSRQILLFGCDPDHNRSGRGLRMAWKRVPLNRLTSSTASFWVKVTSAASGSTIT